MFFFFKDTATTEIYTLSLHDALPISRDARLAPRGRGLRPLARQAPAHRARVGEGGRLGSRREPPAALPVGRLATDARPDRKSTRLNSSHANMSYAVFCLKNTTNTTGC